MEGIIHIRIDDRLIHGQVATQWTNDLGATRIMAINDEVATNPTLKTVLRMAAPPNVSTSIITRETAVTNIKAGKYTGQKVLIVVKSPFDILYLMEQGLDIKTIKIIYEVLVLSHELKSINEFNIEKYLRESKDRGANIMTLRQQSDYIIRYALHSVLPDEAVKAVLTGDRFCSVVDDSGKLYLVAIGKAAWQMAQAAAEILDDRLDGGIVLTKYDHVKGEIQHVECLEAGHPVPDENSFEGTQKILDMTAGLSPEDVVLFLISGGGSALFEKPLVSGKELEDVTKQLLASGANIKEMNTIRKRLSAVKGGRFAQHVAPAKIFSIVLSDIIGDPLDMIASGPACADQSTCEETLEIADRYGLKLKDSIKELLKKETPKELHNVETVISGSVSALCTAAKEACEELGYESVILTDRLDCEAKEAGAFLASIAKTHCCNMQGKRCGDIPQNMQQNEQQKNTNKLAFIAGGETVVHLHGTGKGGRNQELALSAAIGLDGMEGVALFSIGSDGTDGPTDAAGGYVDGKTCEMLRKHKTDIYHELRNNNAYATLEKCDGLIKTGPTGTNVNDVTVLLIEERNI